MALRSLPTPCPRVANEFLGICIEDEAEIYQALELIKETGLLTSFHAENQPLIDLFVGRMQATGRSDPMAFIESRPPVVEALTVAQLIALCQGTGTRVHIAHVSWRPRCGRCRPARHWVCR
ncbi:MAG: hypothetical protein R2932_42440 [Caldilineaceae bacterium]